MAASPDGAVQAIRVMPDVTGVDRSFIYLAPMPPVVRVGMIVRVNLAGRRVRAWVIEEDIDAPEGIEYKLIEDVVSLALDADTVKLAHFAAWRYAGRLRPFLLAGSPRRIVKEKDGQSPRGSPGPRPTASLPDESDPVVSGTRAVIARADGLLELPPTASRLTVVETVLEHLSRPSGRDRDLLVLVPERRDVETLARHLRRRGERCAILPEEFDLARSGGVVVIGTRNATFGPVRELGAIVVLDVHSSSYVDQRAPTWNAAVVATERARLSGVPIVKTSPCPPLSLVDEREIVRMSRTFESQHWPAVEVIDRRGDDPRSGLYSPGLASIIRNALDHDDRPVACLLHRSGRLRLLACSACGEIARCISCEGAMEQRARPTPGEPAALSCSSCQQTRPKVCARCGSGELKTLRIGAARAAEELEALVGVRTELVTGDQHPHQAAEQAVSAARVIVGTEAVLHRLSVASLVVYLDFDQHLLAPRFGAAEEALALLVLGGRLVGGRAQRRGAPFARRLVLQSRLPDHVVVRSALAGDPAPVREIERQRRLEARLPPYSAFAIISGEAAVDLAGRLEKVEGIEVIRVEGATSTKSDPLVARFVVRAPTSLELCQALETVDARGPEVRIEVDPASI